MEKFVKDDKLLNSHKCWYFNVSESFYFLHKEKDWRKLSKMDFFFNLKAPFKGLSERRQTLFLEGVNQYYLITMISTNSWNAYFIVYQEFFFSRRTKKIEEKLSQMDFFFNLKRPERVFFQYWIRKREIVMARYIRKVKRKPARQKSLKKRA